MSWLALIPAALQLATSGFQMFKGHQLAKNPVPEYEIPEALERSEDVARREYLGESPMGISAEQQIRSNQANTVTEMLKAGATPADISKTQSTTDRSTLELGGMLGQLKQNQLSNYLGTLTNLAGEQRTKLSWETLDPYLQRMNTSSALTGAGMQNMSIASQGIADYYESQDYRKWMEELYSK